MSGWHNGARPGRRAGRLLALLLAAALLPAGPASGQSLLERTPSAAGVWGVQGGAPVFVLSHRFELQSGGDELLNFPVLTVALGLPWQLTAGLGFTSNSEIREGALGGNEAELWLQRHVALLPGTRAAVLASYNTAAESVDGALSVVQRVAALSLLAEARVFSDLFGTGDAGAAGLAGIGLALTPYLQLSADVGRVLSDDGYDAVWSTGVAAEIPGTPHTLALFAGNSAAATLQGGVHPEVLGPESVRYGFAFTVPLGTRSQWSRIFSPAPPPPAPAAPDDAVAARVEIRQIAFQTQEVRIRAGESVEWVNLDPVVHTVTGDGGDWGSELLQEGDRYVQRFDEPGRYPYHCIPHPMMTAVVIVEP